MDVVVHRVNTIDGLSLVPPEFGVEIDLRAERSQIILNRGLSRAERTSTAGSTSFAHGLLVLNIKEAGIEADVLKRVRAHGISRCFSAGRRVSLSLSGQP